MDEKDWTKKALHNKLDHMIGRLDVFQNTLESQNQKLRALDEKLVELTTQFENESSFSIEPQNETLTVGPVLKAKLSDLGQVSPMYSIPGLSDIIKEVRIRLKGLDQKTDLIQNKLFGTCDDISSSSISEDLRGLKMLLEKVNTSMTSLPGRLETVETNFATVVQKIESMETSLNDGPKTVKEDLKKNIATVVQKIDSIETSLNDGHKTVKEDLKKNIATVVQKIDSIETSLNDGHKTVKEDLKKNIATVVQKIDSIETSLNDGHKTVKEDLKKNIATVVQKIDSIETSLNDGHKIVKEDLGKNMATVVQKIDSVKTSLNYGHKTVKDLKKNMATVVQKINSVKTPLNDGHKTLKEDLKKNLATVVQKIDSVETSLNDGHKTVKEDLLCLKQGQDLVTTKIEQSTNEVQVEIYRSKREIFAVTEKEAQIVRDRIEGPLSSLGKYSFDFYVENFKTLVRSGKGVYSPPWHINEVKTSRAGCVWFETDGKIKVRFIYGRRPREVGLQPRPPRRLKVKATICDVHKKVLPDIVLGEGTREMDETIISHNGDWYCPLGETSCDDLINKGYGQKEGYWWGAILIRYDVTVL